MGQVDRFFDEENRAIAVESKAIALRAAEELRQDVMRQIRRNFNNPSTAFIRGVKVYEFDNASYVRLSPLLSDHTSTRLSDHAEVTKLRGTPNIWILLPDGVKLGFKRIGKEFNWDTLKRRFGTKISFVPVDNGTVVLYRSSQGVKPIYKIQGSVTTKQRIDFYEKAEDIAKREGFEYERSR